MINIVNPTTQARRRFRIQSIILVMALFTLATTSQFFSGFVASERWINILGITIVVVMVIAVVFLFAAFIRYTLRTDELDRKMTVESLAIAGGATALIAIMYGSLEAISMLPRPHAIWTFQTFIVGFPIVRVLLRHRYK